MHNVTVHWGKETRVVQAPEGQNLLKLLEEEQIIISAPCQGKGRCQKCHVIVDGKDALACQTQVNGDMEVCVPRSEGSGLSVFSTAPWPQGHEGLGIALDVGTTTLAAVLVDLSCGKILDSRSMLNPQRVCGALTIKELQDKAKLTLVSATSIVEGGAHDVILKDTSNSVK